MATSCANPKAVTDFIRKNEAEIRPLGKAATELKMTSDYLAAHQEHKELIQKSALARFAQSDSETAVRSIWNSKDPAGTTRQLMRSFGTNQDAREGLGQVFLKRLMDGTRGDFIKIQNILDTPRFRDTLSAVLNDDQMARLQKNVKVAAQIASGDENAYRGIIAKRFTIMGRLLGAFIGRKLETGTLQAPQYFANTFGAMTERLLQTHSPQTLFTRAVMSPQWERLLWSRAPTTTKEMRGFTRFVRRTIGAEAAAEDNARRKGNQDE